MVEHHVARNTPQRYSGQKARCDAMPIRRRIHRSPRYRAGTGTSNDQFAGLRGLEVGSDPLGGLKRLGDEVERSGSRRGSVPTRQRRRRWRTALVVGIVVLIVAGGLVGGEYGYVQWKLSQIKSVKCRSCKKTVPGKPFNVLVVGSDSRVGDTGSAAKSFGSASQVGGQRSDTIKIVHVDPAAGTARVLSIPRDTFVSLSGMPASSGLSTENKINTAFDDGIEPLVQTIQNTLGIPINHYVTIDFSGVINLVNAVGTIALNFPYPARDDDLGNNNSGLEITQPGCQSLNGNMALALARSRFYQYYEHGSWYSDPSGDLGRIERQNIVISAIIDKAKGNLNPIALNRVLGAVVGDITKDPQLSGNGLVSLATQYHAFSGSSLQTWTLPTAGVKTNDYGDVQVVQEASAQQVVAQVLGASPPLPITTPPLDDNGHPQVSQSTSTIAATAPPSAPSSGTGTTRTTVPQESPSSFDPTVC
jgi:LCP family protein required for cell wall assembly